MRHLILLNKAKNDLRTIKIYTVNHFGRIQSTKYLQELHNILQMLAQNPTLGTEKPEVKKGFYSFPHRSHIIYYLYDEKTTWIVRVLHKSMLHSLHLDNLRP